MLMPDARFDLRPRVVRSPLARAILIQATDTATSLDFVTLVAISSLLFLGADLYDIWLVATWTPIATSAARAYLC